MQLALDMSEAKMSRANSNPTNSNTAICWIEEEIFNNPTTPCTVAGHIITPDTNLHHQIHSSTSSNQQSSQIFQPPEHHHFQPQIQFNISTHQCPSVIHSVSATSIPNHHPWSTSHKAPVQVHHCWWQTDKLIPIMLQTNIHKHKVNLFPASKDIFQIWKTITADLKPNLPTFKHKYRPTTSNLCKCFRPFSYLLESKLQLQQIRSPQSHHQKF